MGAVLVALLLAVFVPALIVHFTVGRNGGHRLFEDMPPDQVRDLPLEMVRFRLRHQLRGAIAILSGLAVALAFYAAGCTA